jgi:hypothetical protein
LRSLIFRDVLQVTLEPDRQPSARTISSRSRLNP